MSEIEQKKVKKCKKSLKICRFRLFWANSGVINFTQLFKFNIDC